ncbi:MAG: thiamine pyrophosphate-binding protein [Variibacter sp.]|nr:thiamine pyrophosphate-binding protein [Variibacter sp.]
MTAVELFVAALRRHEIEWMATLCGHGLDPLFQAARAAGMRLVDARNEQTASYVAEAWGRLTGKPGVCAVSSGVAHINALTGVANAWFDGAPMLLVSGAASTATAGRGHFQDMDQPAAAGSLCKYARTVARSADMLPALEEALAESVSGRPGPVHLTLPMDVQRADGIEAAAPVRTAPAPVAGDASETLAALARARRPVVVAGSGVYYARAGEAMLAFCERHSVPVATPIWDRGSVRRPSGVFMGVVGAATGGPALLDAADCIVMAGAECDYRVGYLEPPVVAAGARVVRFEGDWNALDAAPSWPEWLAECVRERDEFRAGVVRRGEEQARAGMHALDVVRAIAGVLDRAPALIIDGGSIGQWAHQLLCRDRYPGDWLTCGRSGVVGYGVGGAMAARLAFPGRPVILLSGDGAFTFNVADIEAAARQKLPFVAVVADDEGWGITRVGHVRQFGEAISSSLGPIDFAALARSLGARGVPAADPAALARELSAALDRDEVTVIHAPIVGGNP